MPAPADRITDIFADRQDAISATLAAQAEEIAAVTVPSVLQQLAPMQRTEFTRAVVDGITDTIISDYKAPLLRGGTICIEPVIEDIGGGMVKVTTKQKFIPWLNDMSKRDADAIADIFAEGTKTGMHPTQQARLIKDYFESTKHNAVTAARTEAQKLHTDAKMVTYRGAGVRYMQYVTAGDDRVRPDHADRDGRIYRIQDAPYLGEPNCRCDLIDADFAVEERGMPVEEDGGVIVSAEEMGL